MTFVAYEWTSHFGHKVVLFPDKNVPEKIMVRSRRKEDNPYALWQFLRSYGAITIPHHTLSFQVTTNWFYKDNISQPLVEIYSKHGSCEYPGSLPIPYKITSEKGRSVLEALDRGHQLGFVGCSDTHCSKPGSEKATELLTHRIVLKYKSGLTGIYAEDLTRAKIWEALLARRTFATTGIRPFVDFRVGGHFMGEAFTTTEAQTISAWIEAQSPLKLIEIVKNGQVLASFDSGKSTETISLPDPKPEQGQSYYYLRLTFKGGERVWSSPIWVTYE